MAYDVFISYRREGGSEMARLIYDRLSKYGITAFLDIEEMRSGPFNTQLYDRIDECGKVVLILPPHALDRCRDANDWVRLELEHAMAGGKTIIPVMLRAFEFPGHLPESLKQLPFFNGLTANIDYFDAVMDRLVRLIGDGRDGSSAAIPAIDIHQMQAFSSCGLEDTVFQITKDSSGSAVDISINFEPTRIRQSIPQYAGVYFILDRPFRANPGNALSFTAASPDGGVGKIQVEIKPEGKRWMHEKFQFEVGRDLSSYRVDFSDVLNKKTLTCIEEITFVLTPAFFTNETLLTGCLRLEDIKIT